MSLQEEFVLNIESRIREWEQKIRDLERKFKSAPPDARMELRRRIEEFRHHELDARRKLQEYRDNAGLSRDPEAVEHAGDVLSGVFRKDR